jgi:hypothetical protein
MPLESFEQRALLLKIEATEGVDASPAGGANAFRILNGQSGVEAEELKLERDAPYFTADPFVPVGRYGFIEGDVEVVGHATAGQASPLSPLLRIGGNAETLVVGPPAGARYNPISTGVPSASAYFHHGGTRKKLLGARASISGFAFEIKKFPMFKVRIEGNCVEAEEAAMPTPDYSAFVDPMAIEYETLQLSINGFNVDGVMLSVDYGTELKVKEHSEGRIARISDRKPSGVLRFYRPAFASLNPWTLWKNLTKVPIFALLDNGTAARKIKKNLGYCQLGVPKEIEIERDLGYEIPFVPLPQTGNDEFVLEFGF